jgi:hypothetical protein
MASRPVSAGLAATLDATRPARPLSGGGGAGSLARVQLTRFHPATELYGLLPRAWSADGTRLLAGLAGLDAWTAREAYAVDPIHGGSRLIGHSLSPAAFSRAGRYVIGQTGDAESTGLAGSNIVRVPWTRGGGRHILLRHAVEPSFNG